MLFRAGHDLAAHQNFHINLPLGSRIHIPGIAEFLATDEIAVIILFVAITQRAAQTLGGRGTPLQVTGRHHGSLHGIHLRLIGLGDDHGHGILGFRAISGGMRFGQMHVGQTDIFDRCLRCHRFLVFTFQSRCCRARWAESAAQTAFQGFQTPKVSLPTPRV